MWHGPELRLLQIARNPTTPTLALELLGFAFSWGLLNDRVDPLNPTYADLN
jgi:hypothetical protein